MLAVPLESAAVLATALPGLGERLTAREREILVLLAAGTPNPRVADELVVTVHSQKHVSHVLGKLGAANLTEAVTRAPGQPDSLARDLQPIRAGTIVLPCGWRHCGARQAGCGRLHRMPTFG